MQEKIEIISEDISGIDGAEDLQQFLIRNIEQIRLLILAYHYAQKERVFDLEIGETVFKDENIQKGLFRASYKTNIFNGCSDLDLTEKKEMIVTFWIDATQNTITLSGEYMPERYPDEF